MLFWQFPFQCTRHVDLKASSNGTETHPHVVSWESSIGLFPCSGHRRTSNYNEYLGN